MQDSPDDIPSGPVFSSLEEAPSRKRRLLLFTVVAAVAGLALIWPIYPSVASIQPYVLGLPFSLAWVVGWLVVVFVALVLLYHSEEVDSDAE